MTEAILMILLYASVVIGFLAYRKQRILREDVEDRLAYMTLRAEEVYTWCSAEFPQIGDAALFVVAYEAKQTHIKQTVDYPHKGSVDQFLDYMRRWYIKDSNNE